MKRLSRRYKAGLDLGASKICCWVAQREEEQPVQEQIILGTGHAASHGIGPGQWTDVRGLQEAIITVLYEAEKQAHVQIRKATVALGGSFFLSEYCVVQTLLPYGVVGEENLRDLYAHIKHTDLYPIHIIPIEFTVDHQEKIKDPRGICGKNLVGRFHVLWMSKGHVETLRSCLKRCQVQVEHLVFSGYTSALACLTPDERELGVTLVDLGASSTTLSFFSGGLLTGCKVIPLGGHHITQDIARGCDTQLAHAERLKILHGAALVTVHDHHETVPLVPMGDWKHETSAHTLRSFLITIIQARCEEILGGVKKKIGHAQEPQRMVFAGGGSQLLGLMELAKRTFFGPIRISIPLALPKANRHSGEFSSVIGALLYEKMLVDQWNVPREKKFSFFSWLKKI